MVTATRIKVYQQSEKGKAANRRYRLSSKGRTAQRRYCVSPKGRTQTKARNRRYYLAHKDQWRVLGKARRTTLQRLVDHIKQRPCINCRQTFPPVAMDLDHVRGQKNQKISTMVAHGVPEWKLRRELAKCEVICAVCHRLRHSQ